MSEDRLARALAAERPPGRDNAFTSGGAGPRRSRALAAGIAFGDGPRSMDGGGGGGGGSRTWRLG